jgi:3-deoxy-manno-octulosonate cytidylyltransferase (CMP-KDO synthetase)
MPVNVIGVIPCRLGSKRLPGKPLLRGRDGRTILNHVYDRAKAATSLDRVIVACPHDEPDIMDECLNIGAGSAWTTTGSLPTGLDRMAAVVRDMIDTYISVDIQCDQPDLDPAHIDRVVTMLQDCNGLDMATLGVECPGKDLWNPEIVKVVPPSPTWFGPALPQFLRGAPVLAPMQKAYRHIGIYAYRRAPLLYLAAMPQTWIEQKHELEQLRAVAACMSIGVEIVDEAAYPIDTPDAYRKWVHA